MLNKQLLALEKSLGVSALTQIIEPFIQEQKIELYLKRDDLLHPIISGNKWRKLKYILEHVLALNAQKIISMGGAYSNHLHTLAYIGKVLGIQTEAYIRGERPKILNPTLSDLQDWGMHLEFVSRSDYRLLRKHKAYDTLPSLQKGEYWLPEGGAVNLALLGVAELVTEIDLDYDVLCVPCGTATTLAGIVSATSNKQVIGFAALKGAEYLNQEVNTLLKSTACHNDRWLIQHQYHFGGFAKIKPELLHFIRQFEQVQQIKLEPIYTGKMLYGIYNLISQGYFKSGQKIIAIHTGGLQGNRGFSS